MSDCCSANTSNTSCCCAGAAAPAANIPAVSTSLSWRDKLGAWKVRWGIGRMNYTVDPGLYAVGRPDHSSPVLVSANYKLTFDSLRRELGGLDCWLLILDTKGVNVWCAAGKGTFGTAELVNRLTQSGLASVVSHKKLILPQLGAVGVSAHEVKRQSGFTVIYGPVRAGDIKAFLAAGNQATEQMRQVEFNLKDRLALAPMEFLPASKKSIFLFGVLFVLNLVAINPFGPADFVALSGAVLAGTLVTPALLPYIPGRAFALKGGLVGLLWAMVVILLYGWLGAGGWLTASGYLLLLPAITAYLAMNFTGTSTYTSYSGVMKEMRAAIPVMALAAVAGAILLLLSHLCGL